MNCRHSLNRFCRSLGPAVFALAVVNFFALQQRATAGGGPENVLLVVNSASINSQTIANHFIELRHIPACNVVYLNRLGLPDDKIDVEAFRQQILGPIVADISARNLASQIDYVVYSSGFPWTINFEKEIPQNLKSLNVAGMQPFTNSEGSLTSMTYLLSPVLAKDVTGYVGSPAAGWFSSNRYFRARESWKGATYEVPIVGSGPQKGLIPGDRENMPPNPDFAPQRIYEKVDPSSVGSHGFRSWYGWGPQGELMEAGGSRYMLSTILGITAGSRGNSVPEIVSYLQRSATVDGTVPKGTIYFTNDNGIRSTTRNPPVEMVVDQLKSLGVRAEMLKGGLPQDKSDVQGLFCGVAEYDWPATKSTILPGAICETLTSWAGNFERKEQTPLSVFLRHGAAGSSGTVIEPFAIQNKFPYATVQLHYARGCTLAESFYQSVYGPYQLIVVGDPLCRPWANIPQVSVDGATDGKTLKDTVTLRPTATLPRGGAVDRFKLFVDGQSIATCNAGESFSLDTKLYADGNHELRVVGIESGPIESQGRQIIPVRFDNYGKSIQFSVSPERVVRSGEQIKFTAESQKALGIEILQNNRPVARIQGSRGEVTFNSRFLGEGPVTLQAIGRGSGGVENDVYSAPVSLTIESGKAAK